MTVVAGDGHQWMQGDATDRLSSPWAVAWWQDRVWIAMAGIHQLWTFDPATGRTEVAAGTTHEGLRRRSARRGVVRADLGAGRRRRPAVAGRLRDLLAAVRRGRRGAHRRRPGPLRLRVPRRAGRPGAAPAPARGHGPPDRSVAVCDTYNGAVRRYDPATGEVTTLASGLAEPSAAYVDGAELVVVESAAHRLTRVPLGAAARHTDGFSHTTQRPVTEVAAELELVVAFTPPPGQKVDDRFGPPSQLVVEATPPALLREGEGRGTALTRRARPRPDGRRGRPARRCPRRVLRRRGGRTPPATCTSRTGASRSGSRRTPTACSSCRWAGPGEPGPPRSPTVLPLPDALGRLTWATATTSSRSTTTCAASWPSCGPWSRRSSAATARRARPGSAISAMTLRQNDWTLGTYCQTYCRVVTMHHSIEDQAMYPRLRDRRPEPRPRPRPDGRGAPGRARPARGARPRPGRAGGRSGRPGWPASRTALDAARRARCSSTWPTRRSSWWSRSTGLGFGL